ncbi:Oidioi.mRNA.OKI2018_I69.PAR.g12953.t1.cds [Oikopleura dioica]|uniref:Oidioi.mRNA.OKI2018_I69.PAR.g12953.t1.cds n=1 Tax=Oikopleura dioica TaxID=34765 RepID=A0ABN7S705_OIKDI|nr:Oidioi.mRNA.OKI2018_I69.PAR.g12953.t1.cds [Oikopleura dioica]
MFVLRSALRRGAATVRFYRTKPKMLSELAKSHGTDKFAVYVSTFMLSYIGIMLTEDMSADDIAESLHSFKLALRKTNFADEVREITKHSTSYLADEHPRKTFLAATLGIYVLMTKINSISL